MQNRPTKRFISFLNYLKENRIVPSDRQMAMSISVHPQCISDILRGKRKVTIDIIEKCSEKYHLNANYIMTGEGNIISKTDSRTVGVAPAVAVVTDQKGNERIAYVPHSAHAGYVDNYTQPSFYDELMTFTLPDNRYSHGTYRCFDVVGDSMEPSIFSGDKVICSFVEQEYWIRHVKNHYVYVVVTQEGIVVKRIKNDIQINRSITLISDNNYYDSQIIDITEVKEIWQVVSTISPFMSSPSHIRNGLHDEMEGLKETISNQGRLISSLNTTIEKLLKQNRTRNN